METKQQVTRRFALGMIAIVASFIIGKLVWIPIMLFPSQALVQSMAIVYIFSWFLMLWGIYLAGMEGYKLITHKYKEYRAKTAQKMREHGKRVASRWKRKEL